MTNDYKEKSFEKILEKVSEPAQNTGAKQHNTEFQFKANYFFSMFSSVCLTSSVTVLLVTAVHAVGISVTPPAERDAVAVLTLKLVVITLHITAVLQDTHNTAMSVSEGLLQCVFLHSVVLRRTSSDPSAQSWSPSHFHLPAIQRPLVQANSLSEHCLGTDTTTQTSISTLSYLVILQHTVG